MSEIAFITAAAHILCEENDVSEDNRNFAYQADEQGEFTNIEDNFLWMADIDMPFTFEQLTAKAAWIETNEASHFWKNKRRSEYPSIQEQLDMQYWDSVNGTTTWADAIAQVKADNPKP